MYRLIAIIAALSILAAGGSPAIAARVETSHVSSTTTDYPELRITATDTDLKVPAQVPAGRVLVTVENTGTRIHGVVFLPLPTGETPAAMQAEIQAAVASPNGAPPSWYFQGPWLGGPEQVTPGQRGQAVVDLLPARYAVLDGNVFEVGATTVAATQFEAVAGPTTTPAASQEPTADGTVSEQEFAFGLPAQIVAGHHVWKVINAGQQPHEFYVGKVPAGTTVEQVMGLFSAPPDATLPAGGLDFSEITNVGGLSLLSPGRAAWAVLDLAPGTYLAMCFMFDPTAMMPHAAMGMVAVFTVTAEATPTP
jgi:hypothetical protein